MQPTHQGKIKCNVRMKEVRIQGKQAQETGEEAKKEVNTSREGHGGL